MKVEDRYLDGSYSQNNPDWDRRDAPWKALQVSTMLDRHQIDPVSICEIGCGSGDVLRALRETYPRAKLTGYDVSPQAQGYWSDLSAEDANMGIELRLGDFHRLNVVHYEVGLMLDVFEHVRDPFTFLENSRAHAKYFVFHIPLDLSVSSVIRETPLVRVRRQVGHLNFYTKELALETLRDCGYDIVEWRYTGAGLNMPSRPLRTRLAALPRIIVCALNKDFGARLLGGETLIVLAK